MKDSSRAISGLQDLCRGCRLTKETWERGHWVLCAFRWASTTRGWDPLQVNSLHTCLCLSVQMGPPLCQFKDWTQRRTSRAQEPATLTAMLTPNYRTPRTLQIHKRHLKVWVWTQLRLPVPLQGRPGHLLSISQNPWNPSEAERITEMIGQSTRPSPATAQQCDLLSTHKGPGPETGRRRWMRPQPSSSGKREGKT